ncbi:hypothetical protein LEP3755_65760 (plasmid) [Leptolyngbya sp. NIES-3755]|nr:hypothetical protein LEP3755_65760 [Leptolyngbya sp. NIES-3755]
MPNPRKSAAHKRKREIKLALTEAEYQRVVEQANLAGYPPAVFARLVVLGTPFKLSASINTQAWADVGIHLDHLQQILAVLYQAQHDAIDSIGGTALLPRQLPRLFEQELTALRQSCLALIRRSAPASEEAS